MSRHLFILRRYVFDNYTWDKSPGDFSTFNGKNPIPARVPLTALLSGTPTLSPPARMCTCVIFISPSISGPIAGDPFPSSAGASPAVIPEFFDQVCPTRTVIDRDEISRTLGDASAATILQAWLDKLDRTEDRCVEIKEHTPQIFDFWYALSHLALLPFA